MTREKVYSAMAMVNSIDHATNTIEIIDKMIDVLQKKSHTLFYRDFSVGRFLVVIGFA